ncbi:hypothetical protein ACA29_13165 [Lederbergia galactosidilytica]|uniref:Uncharacterized protein n=1 Tax=Lederbergia galactosidilytica TaxID=217031 RepID=A0A0Q9XUP3_9BACI|nr:hypothetical protein ACA29_13165 [Lederbergia galactosidilytica]
MKSNFKNATKIVPLVIGLSLIVGLTIWSVFAINKGEVIPFSSIEKVIQAQSGDVVTLKETADGTINGRWDHLYKNTGGKICISFSPK